MSGTAARDPGAAGERGGFPLGAALTIAELSGEPYPALSRLRAAEPVSWVTVLSGWLVTRRDLAQRVLRDARTFTVDDPRFSTARVVGPSMLSLDGGEHRRHREPFSPAFRPREVHARIAGMAAAQAGRMVAALAPAGAAELRRGLAGPLAATVMARVLGLSQAEPGVILAWYDAIVGAVSALSGDAGARSPGAQAAGAAAFAELRASLEPSLAGPASALLGAASGPGALTEREVVSNAAVLMFGGIETTEGMICNALWHLLDGGGQLGQVLAGPGLIAAAVEESLRLEPAAAMVDRYATADVRIGAAAIRRGDLVSVSLTAANRDPAVFPDPDRFLISRPNAAQNLSFAAGPHFCIGAHLARLEARIAVAALLSRLPALRLDGGRPSRPGGLVFRKPPELWARWDQAS